MKILRTAYYNATATRERHDQLNWYKSVVIWFIGLLCSDKPTLVHPIKEKLHRLNYRAVVLDGDNARHSLLLNFSFSDNDKCNKQDLLNLWIIMRDVS
jgi:adenylylsulfate kinase-like enzyme